MQTGSQDLHSGIRAILACRRSGKMNSLKEIKATCAHLKSKSLESHKILKLMSPSEVTQLSSAQKISMFNKVCRTTNLIMYYGHCLFSFWCKCLFAKLVCSSFCLRLSQIVQVFLDGSCILFHLIFLLIIGSRNICFSLQMPSEFLSDTDFLILKA